MKITGVYNGEYGMIHHYGEDHLVKKTYDALLEGAKKSGAQTWTIFYVTYPLIKEEVESFFVDGFEHWANGVMGTHSGEFNYTNMINEVRPIAPGAVKIS